MGYRSGVSRPEALVGGGGCVRSQGAGRTGLTDEQGDSDQNSENYWRHRMGEPLYATVRKRSSPARPQGWGCRDGATPQGWGHRDGTTPYMEPSESWRQAGWADGYQVRDGVMAGVY